MISDSDLIEINPKIPTCSASALHIQNGLPISKVARVCTFSPNEWEEFVEEWANSLNNLYPKVRRMGGAADLGIDIAAFSSDQGFCGIWDNYQCKRYDHPLRPSDIWIEIGKIIYYSFLKKYIPPRKHYFICSKGISTSLEKLLNGSSSELKKKTEENWNDYCFKKISSVQDISLIGQLGAYFSTFDFSIFSSKSHVELIEMHSKTPFHAVRFGGGLKPRPNPITPPPIPIDSESKYIKQLLDAYSEHLGSNVINPIDLEKHPVIKRDYLRQRERFYHAESLRNFARDTVPEGTFDALQTEIFHGVIDICENSHHNGFERMRATVTQAANVVIGSNPLSSAVRTQDRQGICHQLANDHRLIWCLKDE